jgi:hypothetical protein
MGGGTLFGVGFVIFGTFFGTSLRRRLCSCKLRFDFLLSCLSDGFGTINSMTACHEKEGKFGE